MMTNSAYVAQALGFYGPMNVEQILEKVKMRVPTFTKEDVEHVINVHCDKFTGAIKPAEGFSVPTYKVTHCDVWKSLT